MLSMRFRISCPLTLVLLGSQSFAQSEPNKVQYGVYSAFLQIQLDGNRGTEDLRVGENMSAISSHIQPINRRLTGDGQSELKSQLSEMEPETLQSLVSCSSRSFVLTHRLTLKSDYQFLAPDSVIGHYGYIEFSCVGLNKAETQAAFHVSRRKCYCAVGKWVLMKKTPDGKWVVVKETADWIS